MSHAAVQENIALAREFSSQRTNSNAIAAAADAVKVCQVTMCCRLLFNNTGKHECTGHLNAQCCNLSSMQQHPETPTGCARPQLVPY